MGALAWKQEGDGDRRNLVGLDDFAPVVVATVTTDRVRLLRLVALRALDELHALYRQVGAALPLAGVGVPGLWKSHGQPIIRRGRGVKRSVSPLLEFGYVALHTCDGALTTICS